MRRAPFFAFPSRLCSFLPRSAALRAWIAIRPSRCRRHTRGYINLWESFGRQGVTRIVTRQRMEVCSFQSLAPVPAPPVRTRYGTSQRPMHLTATETPFDECRSPCREGPLFLGQSSCSSSSSSRGRLTTSPWGIIRLQECLRVTRTTCHSPLGRDLPTIWLTNKPRRTLSTPAPRCFQGRLVRDATVSRCIRIIQNG